MNTEEILKGFASDLGAECNVDETAHHIEKHYFSHVLKIIQKDSSFFDEERTLFDLNLSAVWKASEDDMKETIWKKLQLSLFASFLHGDVKKKVESLFDLIKGMWEGKDDDISKIINDEKSEGHFKEILDFIMNTRLAKIFTKMIEEFDFSDLDLDLENPDEIIELFKNPEHPKIQKLVNKVQNVIKEKVQRGEINQNQIMGEVEAIKAKLTGLFGNIFKDAFGVGGGAGSVPSSVMLGNSPEARRQRMLARLQKKQRDKNSR
jgi:hypothetical protein